MGIFDYNAYEGKLDQLKGAYRSAECFPHGVFDNFIDAGAINQAVREFPGPKDDGWVYYVHYNEKKRALRELKATPAPLRGIIEEFNSPRFVRFLSELTGIPNLIPDPSLEGGGLHEMDRGGFLNLHADFTAHPHHRMWRRRVNVLLYLNPDWKEEYGGQLELWTKDMQRCFEKIVPVLNRCVIFNTDSESFHGHPAPLACPDTTTRKSIALYYFTEETTPPLKVATNYQARPGDGFKALFIYLDNKILSLYNYLKGVLGINDGAVSALLKKLSEKNKS